MKSMKAPVSTLLLIGALSIAMTACSDTPTQTGSEDNQNTETIPAETTQYIPELHEINRENAVLTTEMPDLGGLTINVLHSRTKIDAQDVVGDADGDIVDVSVYERNLWLEELLNITWNPISVADTTYDTVQEFTKTIVAAEDIYDLASVHQGYTVKKVAEGYFVNLKDDAYIDWEKPWWDTEYMDEISVGDQNRYFLQGDISLMRMKSLSCMYYNKQLCADLYEDADYMYEVVLDGKWTFDLFSKMTKDVYSDVNGNGQADKGDRFGAFVTCGKSVEHLFHASGVYVTEKNKDGIPEIIVNNDRAANFSEKIFDFYYNNIGVTMGNDDAYPDEVKGFINGEYFFAPLWFRQAEELRDMDTDYGIICYPKYAEEDQHTTLVHDGTTIFCVPVTSDTTDKIGAVCEAMAYYNYKNCTPAYFEVALKVKYTRDTLASQVVDLISNSAYTNFGYVYYPNLNGLDFRKLMSSKNNNFASWYAKFEKAGTKGLNSVIEAYMNADT